MSVERIIGVDFGTSASVIRVKRYQDGKPVGNQLETKNVTFNMGSAMVPTLIQKLKTGGAYFGYEADNARRGSSTYSNFKVDIENPDDDIRRQARDLTSEFFAYLAKTYKLQSESGHLGQSDDQERTIISYPVKWNRETKDFMIGLAKAAGFPNVEGIDEAQAAIQAVTVQNAGLLADKGYFREGVPVHILLIDMGAGTTDLVLCSHTPGNQPKTEILSIWPKEDSALFGGREVDELLKSFIGRTLPEEDADVVLKKIGIEKYKAWKESMVSPALQRGEAVDYFAALDDLLSLLEIEAEYSIDRDSFESFAADYLREFPKLVNDCVDAAGISGDDVDLVILTGGHSQWYFVQEMLGGTMNQFGKINLGKIQSDPDRIVHIALPQETVALGLAYGPMRVEERISVPDVKVEKSQKEEIGKPTVAGHKPVDPNQVPYTPENEFKVGIGSLCSIKKYKGNASVVKIPEFIKGKKVVEIGDLAFCGNKKIEMVIIPRSITKIGGNAFSRCTKLKTVIAHNKIQSIEFGAFSDCQNLGTIDFGMGKCAEHIIVFPPSLNELGGSILAGWVFANNRMIEKVCIPESVKVITYSAFYGCTNLKTVIAHDMVEAIDSKAFYGCDKLETIDFGIGKCIAYTAKFPAKIKEIGEGAFTTSNDKSILKNVMLSAHTDTYGYDDHGRRRRMMRPQVAFGNDCTITYYDK